jgi:hypothetical protein
MPKNLPSDFFVLSLHGHLAQKTVLSVPQCPPDPTISRAGLSGP